jgi:hypothetical protein
MSNAVEPIEAAALELAHGNEAHALELLRDLLAETDDHELAHEIHELAVTAHDHSHGLHRIEWQRLAIDATAREAAV